MRVSVIIPVYNRAKFVEKAVHSALMQPETGEVLFVDDGSIDNSLAIGQRLAAKDSRVKVFQHPDKKNHGPSAARNIGLKNAKFEFIAFLDSDDTFVANRFQKTKKIFAKNPTADGVYEAVKLVDYPDLKTHDFVNLELITFSEIFPPNAFFEKFLLAKTGHCSIVGLTIKREVLSKVEPFDLKLRRAQDVDFMMRLGLKTQLFPGSLRNPVSMIGNHNERSVYNFDGKFIHRRILFTKWVKKIPNNHWSKKANRHIFINYLHFHSWTQKNWEQSPLRLTKKGILAVWYLLRHPKMIFKIL
jgi:glycosyltransferase involved in cell wall biosynthesis